MVYRMNIFIEGDDDLDFFDKILKPYFNSKFRISYIKYQKMKIHSRSHIISICEKRNQEYYFFRDIDNAPCVTEKKNTIMKEIKGCNGQIDLNRIIIVIKRIESWYLAGLDEKAKNIIGIRKKIELTENISKSYFENLIPKNITRTEFLIEILNNYNLSTAKKNNKSFRYFFKKFIENNPQLK